MTMINKNRISRGADARFLPAHDLMKAHAAGGRGQIQKAPAYLRPDHRMMKAKGPKVLPTFIHVHACRRPSKNHPPLDLSYLVLEGLDLTPRRKGLFGRRTTRPVNLQGWSFEESNLPGVKFTKDTKLDGANFTGVEMPGATFPRKYAHLLSPEQQEQVAKWV